MSREFIGTFDRNRKRKIKVNDWILYFVFQQNLQQMLIGAWEKNIGDKKKLKEQKIYLEKKSSINLCSFNCAWKNWICNLFQFITRIALAAI